MQLPSKTDQSKVQINSLVNPRHPRHLPLPLRKVHIVFTVDVDPVASMVFGRKTGGIDRTHHLDHVSADFGDGYQPDTDCNVEVLAIPVKPEVPKRLTQLVSNSLGLLQRTVLQQDTELITPPAGLACPEFSTHFSTIPRAVAGAHRRQRGHTNR